MLRILRMSSRILAMPKRVPAVSSAGEKWFPFYVGLRRSRTTTGHWPLSPFSQTFFIAIISLLSYLYLHLDRHPHNHMQAIFDQFVTIQI
jgi:hypothetical protein